MMKSDTSKKEERKEITRADIMERLRECWERLKFDGRKLTCEIKEKLDYNFSLVDLYIKLQGKDESEQGEPLFACGFEYEEDEDEDEG